jgi:4-amino-4-deoxy-L-arabinose transferase-like glycosyltransferase
MTSVLPAKTPFTKRELIILLAIAVVALSVRLTFLHEPFERDEGFYSAIGQVILRGGIPYRDAIDMKPPGVFYVYAFAMTLFGKTTESIRIFTAIYSLLTMGGVFWLGRSLFGSKAGLFAAFFFAVFSGAPLVQGSSSNSEVIMLLPLVLAGCLFVAAVQRQDRRYLAASGFCAGLAMLVKTVALPYVALIFVCSLFLKRPGEGFRGRLLNVAVFVAPMAALAILTLGYFYAKGAFDDFVLWNVTIPIFYSKGGGVSGPPLGEMVPYLTAEFLCLVLVAVPTAIWLLVTKRDLASIYVALLLPAAWLGVWMPGKYFPHYFIQLFPFLALLAGIGAAQVFSRRWILLAVAGPVIVAAFLYYPYREHEFFHRYTPEEVSMIKYGTVFADSVYVARYVRERTTPSDSIFQWGFEPELYFLADRPTITPYISSTIIANLRDPKPALLSLMDSLNRRKPKYIIVQPEWAEWLGVNELSEVIQRDYDLETRLRYAFIYRRRSS